MAAEGYMVARSGYIEDITWWVMHGWRFGSGYIARLKYWEVGSLCMESVNSRKGGRCRVRYGKNRANLCA